MEVLETSKPIITYKDEFGDFINEITLEMDKFLIDRGNTFFNANTYLLEPDRELLRGRVVFDGVTKMEVDRGCIPIPIKFPGSTVGVIRLDDNHIIKSIFLNHDSCFDVYKGCYMHALEKVDFKKYIGRKLLISYE